MNELVERKNTDIAEAPKSWRIAMHVDEGDFELARKELGALILFKKENGNLKIRRSSLAKKALPVMDEDFDSAGMMYITEPFEKFFGFEYSINMKFSVLKASFLRSHPNGIKYPSAHQLKKIPMTCYDFFETFCNVAKENGISCVINPTHNTHSMIPAFQRHEIDGLFKLFVNELSKSTKGE